MEETTMKHVVLLTLAAVLTLQTPLFADIQVSNPGYKAELFVQLDTALNDPREMAFDSAGNLYITQRFQGSVTKITPDKTVIKNWSSGYSEPWGIEFTEGTVYGDKAYVCQNAGHIINSVNMSGQKSNFTNLNGVSMIKLDTVGHYGGYLYAGSSAQDGVYKILPNGSKQLFCDDFYNFSGGIEGLAFSPFSAYGDKMYIGVFSNDYPHGGLYSVDLSGNATRFSTDLVWAKNLAFDSTGSFGEFLYATGVEDRQGPWAIYCVDESGQAIPFVTSTYPRGVQAYTFGPDGAMYVFEGDWSHYDKVWRITAIPEPITLGLFGLGFLFCRKKR